MIPEFLLSNFSISPYTCIISRVRDSTNLLDGLLYNESDHEIRKQYTDTAGFIYHFFALMHLLGFAFCPRIRDLHHKNLFIKGKVDHYSALQSLISAHQLIFLGRKAIP